MPWCSPFVKYTVDRLQLLPEDMQPMAEKLIADLQQACETSAYRDVMFNHTALVLTQKSTGPLVTHMFGLHLLDIVAAIHLADHGPPVYHAQEAMCCPVHVIPRTVIQGETSKLRGLAALTDAHSWLSVLTNVRDIMRSSAALLDFEETSSITDCLHFNLDSAMSLLVQSLLGDCNGRGISKMLLNMNTAAFFMNHVLQGYIDIPSTARDLYGKFSSEVVDSAVIQATSLVNLPPPSRLRQPLFLALAVSPLILLADFLPMSTNITRLNIIRAWFHYGMGRPPVLVKLEMALWRKLFTVARGVTTLFEALCSFVNEIEPLLDLASPERLFFYLAGA
ncbi:hypothetical protein VNI00_016986 [Paramarasmius palmivorus]|uniref:Uncharacterized protein n=1 Tax=Paramarasmius palmivorus TaxID=297713 RepID=A0AAW0BA00_9AGAR